MIRLGHRISRMHFVLYVQLCFFKRKKKKDRKHAYCLFVWISSFLPSPPLFGFLLNLKQYFCDIKKNTYLLIPTLFLYEDGDQIARRVFVGGIPREVMECKSVSVVPVFLSLFCILYPSFGLLILY